MAKKRKPTHPNIMGRNFIVPMVVYPFDIMFSINQTDKEFSNSLSKKLHKDHFDQFMSDAHMPHMESSNPGTARTIRLTGGQTVMRMNHWDGSAQMHGVVAHEIFHVIEFLFRRIEIKLCNKSDEAYAYAIGYLTEKFYENMN